MSPGSREVNPPFSSPFSRAAPGRTVLLRHYLPDRSWHYDWLIEPPGGDEPERVPTLRLRIRPDEASGPFAAALLEPHRRAYLTYQGPVSGDRGAVRRIASGTCTALAETERGLVFDIVWDDAEPELWRFEARPDPEGDVPDGPSGAGVPLTVTPERAAGR